MNVTDNAKAAPGPVGRCLEVPAGNPERLVQKDPPGAKGQPTDRLPGKFGIVIPCYNQSGFLREALESLRCQSASFELAVLDGGSRDGFHEAVRPYQELIACQRSAPDDGQAAAIREGLARVSGDVVAWLNADDYFFPHTLEKVAGVFDSRPEVDVVYGDAVHVDAEGMFQSYFLPIREFNRELLARNLYICQPACFVRRSAYERVGGVDSRLHFAMDWDLWCRLAADGAGFFYLPEPLAAVRVHPGTKTRSGRRRRYREIFLVERRYGKRRLPKSWAGAYWHQLAQQENRTPLENFLFQHLDRLRRVAKRFHGTEPVPLVYGFHPWEKAIRGTAVIHVPWYGRRVWKTLRLQVTPRDADYLIAIDGGPAVAARARQGELRVPLELPSGRQVRVDIRALNQPRWWLERFDCEFAGD